MLSLFTKINFYFLIQVLLLLYILFIILLYVYVEREADQFEIGTNATMWSWGSPVATKVRSHLWNTENPEEKLIELKTSHIIFPHLSDALHDFRHLYKFKKVKNAHGGVILLLKLQAKVCNFTESNTHPWMFFTFFKSFKWYQITQSISRGHTKSSVIPC